MLRWSKPHPDAGVIGRARFDIADLEETGIDLRGGRTR